MSTGIMYPPPSLSRQPAFGWETKNWHCGEWNEGTALNQSNETNKYKILSYIPFYSTAMGIQSLREVSKDPNPVLGFKLRFSIQLVPVLGNLILFIIDLFATIFGKGDDGKKRKDGLEDGTNNNAEWAGAINDGEDSDDENTGFYR